MDSGLMVQSDSTAEQSLYHIVVGVDYSQLAEQALMQALRLAVERPSARVHVISVAGGYWPQRPEEVAETAQTQFYQEAEATLRDYLDERLRRVDAAQQERLSQRVFIAVDFGTPAERILALAEAQQADLIVLGTHGRTGIERWVVGSVAEQVLRHAHCSVLVVRRKQHQP